MQRLFAYGTLMCPEIMHQVAGPVPPARPALLHGFARHPVRGEVYPAITPESGRKIEGLLYQIADPLAWQRLDAFEGKMYLRAQVRVEIRDKHMTDAQTYVVKPEYLHRLERVNWDYQHFLNHGKALFELEYQGFGDLGE